MLCSEELSWTRFLGAAPAFEVQNRNHSESLDMSKSNATSRPKGNAHVLSLLLLERNRRVYCNRCSVPRTVPS